MSELATILLTGVVCAGALVPSKPRRFEDFPAPQQLRGKMAAELVPRYQRLLESTRRLRQAYEKRNPRREGDAEYIEELKKEEAMFQRWIDQLEGREPFPRRPIMPVVPDRGGRP